MDTTDELTSCWFAQSSLTVFWLVESYVVATSGADISQIFRLFSHCLGTQTFITPWGLNPAWMILNSWWCWARVPMARSWRYANNNLVYKNASYLMLDAARWCPFHIAVRIRVNRPPHSEKRLRK
jgi:hypothetical protein